jgi:hypothetical protein
VAGGVVRGTWLLDGELVRVAWFKESGKVPRNALETEVARLGAIVGRDLDTTISLASTSLR